MKFFQHKSWDEGIAEGTVYQLFWILHQILLVYPTSNVLACRRKEVDNEMLGLKCHQLIVCASVSV